MNNSLLKQRAQALPEAPGVYIMMDAGNQVIYVGKAKKLRNRVSQYFQDTVSHSTKTKQMVSNVDHFEVIVAATEFEALVLECSLIKQHMPKYNILLKDGKGYPYIRLGVQDPYPDLTLANQPADDGALYYGPFGSRGITNNIIQVIKQALKLPVCAKKFPRDINKGRPCLHYHMGQCTGWCQGKATKQEYFVAIEQCKLLLSGKYKSVADIIREQMLAASDALNFELAASLRNSLKAVEALSQKQLVTAGNKANTDVIGFAHNESKACFAVLHFSHGDLVDKDYEILNVPDDPQEALTALVKQYYLNRGLAPRYVYLPQTMDDSALFEQLLQEQLGAKTTFVTPVRGDKKKLVQLADKNAKEEAERITKHREHIHSTLTLLGKMLNISVPERIESFDISNISGTDIVASMIVFCDGKPKRNEYKKFKIRDLDGQDDYASMRQVVVRRYQHLLNKDDGFEKEPDLILIDGGINHAKTALDALESMGLHLPVFGMVKDDRHRTRALVTPQGQEIRIDSNQAVFSLVGNIQEETHGFAIGYHRKLRNKRIRYSALDEIPGIGPKRKAALLKTYKSLSGIASASLFELEKHLPSDAAHAVYQYFQSQQRGEDHKCE